MAKCSLCHVSVSRVHQFRTSTNVSYLCTACNSRLNNGKLLNKSGELTRWNLVLKLAFISASLVTVKGREMLASLVGKPE